MDLIRLTEDIQFVRTILPDHYTIKISKGKKPGSIHCVSKEGIKHRVDADDDEHWGYIVKALESHFGGRLIEICHSTNFCHIDFTIYLRQ